MSIRVEVAAPTVAIAGDRALSIPGFVGLLIAMAIGGWGVQWDIRWHLLIGRDSFWIAPHVMTYAGVTLSATIAFGMLALERARGRASQGWRLAAVGMALTILAAPIDDLWHRLFGIDVTVWSPPHLLGLAGAHLNLLGAMLVAVELWPRSSRRRALGVLVAGTLLLGTCYITVDPGVQTAFHRGGVFFFTWPLLGALGFTFILSLTARASGLRLAPLVVTVAALGLHVVGLGISDAGFALTQPVPAIQEAIAADPTSPIAIAHEMARRSGTVVGRSFLLRWLPILPAAVLTLVDARRRWIAGGIAFGATLFVSAGHMLAGAPSLRHALPAPGDVVLAALLIPPAALAGSAAARWLARRWPSPITPPA